MVTLSNHERDLIETLEQCVAVAVANVEGVTPADLNQTKLQKLIFLAISEFDLPVTYSWYLAGSLVESTTISPSNVESAFDDIATPDSPSIDQGPDGDEDDDPDDQADVAEAPPPANESVPIEEETDFKKEIERSFELEAEADEDLSQADAAEAESDPSILDHFESNFNIDAEEASTPKSDGPTNQGSGPEVPSWPDDDIDTPIEDCITYLETQLKNYPLDSTDRFLIQFYNVHAPDPYHDLYESCLHVRSVLRAATNDVRRVVEGRTESVDMQRHYREIGQHLSDVHVELRRIDELRETSRLFIQCTDVIEDALMMLQERSPTEYREADVQALEALQSFYFEWAWKYPALVISADTATGPSKDEVVAARERTLETFEDRLQQQRADVIARLSSAGLIPDYQDYPDLERESLDETVVDLTNAYMDN